MDVRALNAIEAAMARWAMADLACVAAIHKISADTAAEAETLECYARDYLENKASRDQLLRVLGLRPEEFDMPPQTLARRQYSVNNARPLEPEEADGLAADLVAAARQARRCVEAKLESLRVAEPATHEPYISLALKKAFQINL